MGKGSDFWTVGISLGADVTCKGLVASELEGDQCPGGEICQRYSGGYELD